MTEAEFLRLHREYKKGKKLLYKGRRGVSCIRYKHAGMIFCPITLVCFEHGQGEFDMANFNEAAKRLKIKESIAFRIAKAADHFEGSDFLSDGAVFTPSLQKLRKALER